MYLEVNHEIGLELGQVEVRVMFEDLVVRLNLQLLFTPLEILNVARVESVLDGARGRQHI